MTDDFKIRGLGLGLGLGERRLGLRLATMGLDYISDHVRTKLFNAFNSSCADKP